MQIAFIKNTVNANLSLIGQSYATYLRIERPVRPRVRELGEEFPQLRIRCDWCLRCADWRLAAQGCAAREIRGMQKSDAVAAAPGCPGEALRVESGGWLRA